MKPKSTSIFTSIILLIAGLITCLGAVFIAITYIVGTNYYQSSTQLLNKDVASHIAKYTSPFTARGINVKKADSVFYDAMVLSPSSEIYFLDIGGKVLAYHHSANKIIQWQLPLNIIQSYITANGQAYIKGPDPRDPDKPKIFSAAPVIRDGRYIGYIYVVLASTEARAVANMLVSNNVVVLLIIAFSFIIIFSIILSFLYVKRIERRFYRVVDVLEKFEQGDYEARFQIHNHDGLSPIKHAFNTMADMLVYHIKRLTKSEADRKMFIAGITHDLRNPLSIAGGYAETLLMQSRQGSISYDSQNEYAQLILQKINKAENMVQHLHELSSLESAAFEPKREPFMFSELLQQVAHSLKIHAGEKNIIIDCKDCEDDSYINADVGMMERVIQNLLVNAIDYSTDDTVILVSLKHTAGNLIGRIENNGAPLSENILQWLSDPDRNAQPVSFKPALGLSIVRRILDIHHYPLNAKNTKNTVVFEFLMEVFSMHLLQ